MTAPGVQRGPVRLNATAPDQARWNYLRSCRSGNYEDLAKRALEEGENNPSAETDRAFIKAQAYATLALVKTVEEVIRVMPA